MRYGATVSIYDTGGGSLFGKGKGAFGASRDAGLNDVAGRTAYLAGFHAAQALIFERTGKISKTHSGVQAEFSRLAKAEPAIGQTSRTFLGRAYGLKAIADYETGSASRVTEAQAAEAMAAAKAFVECLAALLSDGTG